MVPLTEIVNTSDMKPECKFCNVPFQLDRVVIKPVAFDEV